tara:strand:+ start:26498 stop:26659 length:162 start_codon:yes stop_codon:yes gene_type:complete
MQFKKKTTLSKSNSYLNGEWGGQTHYGKKITSGKRRMFGKELIIKELKEEEWR